ncbi:MAG: sulfatase [Planctomycetota bacterium]|nr:sulfatase [Planctomycetota bacterium]
MLLISIDTLRADHLGCYGYARDTSPHIDTLAREGALFRWAIASGSRTLPSHVALFTSVYAPIHGADLPNKRLENRLPVLPGVLKDAGYATLGFYSGHFLRPQDGFARGFDHYYNCSTYVKPGDEVVHDVIFNRTPGPDEVPGSTNPLILGSLESWLEKPPQEPFFAFVHIWDVHMPYAPPSPYDKMFPQGDGLDPYERAIALYDGGIRATDEMIGDVLELLRNHGVLDRTLIILTSDHGEEFSDHGQMGHAKTLFDESIRVPLVMRLPGVIRPGLKIESQVRLIDVFPTVLEIVRRPPPSSIFGVSLLPALDGRKKDIDLPPAYSSLRTLPGRDNPPLRSLRTSRWKIIERQDTKEITFYDLTADPKEQAGVAPRESARAREALAVFREHIKLLDDLGDTEGVAAETEAPEKDPELMERLRSLGYVK